MIHHAWKSELAADALHDKLSALDAVFTSLQGTTLDKWSCYFSKEFAKCVESCTISFLFQTRALREYSVSWETCGRMNETGCV